ncbi:hypothetical protein PINS_up023147 [Pythium insidiosum]|nr:hypothetical protein PINS_up023147 [Pythium insidiosum]
MEAIVGVLTLCACDTTEISTYPRPNRRPTNGGSSPAINYLCGWLTLASAGNLAITMGIFKSIWKFFKHIGKWFKKLGHKLKKVID